MHEGLHESLKKYISVADVFKNAAERQYQLPLPKQTYHAWKSTLAAMRMVDYGFDSLKTQSERQLFKNRVLAFMQGKEDFETNEPFLQNYLKEFRNCYRQLSVEKQRSLLINAGLIFNIGEMIKNTSDINKFSKLTKLEGQVTSRLLIAFLPESYQKDQHNPSFAKWCKRLGRAGNSFDSFIDLSDDYNSGEIVLKPSFGNRTRLIFNIIGDSLFLLSRVDIFLFGGFINAGRDVINNNPNRK